MQRGLIVRQAEQEAAGQLPGRGIPQGRFLWSASVPSGSAVRDLRHAAWRRIMNGGFNTW